MSKSQKIMALGEQLIRAGVEKRNAITGPSATNIKLAKQAMDDVMPKLQVIANRQDRLLEIARAYLYELEYNDYVTREPLEIAEAKRLIAECEGKDE